MEADKITPIKDVCKRGIKYLKNIRAARVHFACELERFKDKRQKIDEMIKQFEEMVKETDDLLRRHENCLKMCGTKIPTKESTKMEAGLEWLEMQRRCDGTSSD